MTLSDIADEIGTVTAEQTDDNGNRHNDAETPGDYHDVQDEYDGGW